MANRYSLKEYLSKDNGEFKHQCIKFFKALCLDKITFGKCSFKNEYFGKSQAKYISYDSDIDIDYNNLSNLVNRFFGNVTKVNKYISDQFDNDNESNYNSYTFETNTCVIKLEIHKQERNCLFVYVIKL